MDRQHTHLVITLFLISIFYSLVSHAEESDFDVVCRYFNDLDKLPDVNAMSHTERGAFILAKIRTNLSVSSNAHVAWVAIDSAVAEQRYALFQSAAESVLNTPWKCKAMETWAIKTGEF